jgi:hypothetical protein
MTIISRNGKEPRDDAVAQVFDRKLLSMGKMLPLALIVISFFSLQPLAAIGYSSFRFFGDSTGFYLSILYYVLPGGMIALVLGALRVAQGMLKFTSRIRTAFGFLFIILQFTAAMIQVWITGASYIGGYFAHTITTDFVALAIIVGLSFAPAAIGRGKIWFFPLYFYSYVLPASLLVRYFYMDAIGLYPDRAMEEMFFWAGGVIVQVATFIISVNFRLWREFAGQFFE